MTRVARARIGIVKGSERTLARYASDAAALGGLVVPASCPGLPYAAAHALLAALCERTGSVVDAPTPGSSTIGRAMLPRADATDGDRVDAWQQALAFALDGEKGPVIVHARRIDLSSLRLLRPTWRRACAPPLLVVLDAPLPTEDEVDPIARVLQERVGEEIAQLRALPWARRELLTDTDVFRREPPRAAEPAAGTVDDVRRAFAEHAFDAALLLGRTLLDRAGELAPRDRAELHAMCALSAASVGAASLETFVEHHLRAALGGGLGAADRASILFAQCAAMPSLESARRAIEAARRVPPATGRYLEAWGRRARAEELAIAGRIEDAIDDLEEGVALLSSAALDLPEPEIHRTQHLLALDLSRANAARGDADGAAGWRAQASACAALLPVGWTLPRVPLDLKLERSRLGDAIAEREACAARARSEWDPVAESAYLRELSALHACRGEATRSHACARLAKRIAEASRACPAALLIAELTCAQAAFRAGKLESAAAAVESALGAVATSADEADLHGMLACIAAKRGQTSRAEDSSLEALARLDANAPADVAASVLVRVGEAYLLLGRADAARRVFALALGWSDALTHDLIGPADRLSLLLGMWATGARDRELIDDALGCASEALLDPDAWWQLPRLLEMIEGVYLDVDDALLEVVVEIRHLAAQRRTSDWPPSERLHSEQPQKKALLYV